MDQHVCVFVCRGGELAVSKATVAALGSKFIDGLLEDFGRDSNGERHEPVRIPLRDVPVSRLRAMMTAADDLAGLASHITSRGRDPEDECIAILETAHMLQVQRSWHDRREVLISDLVQRLPNVYDEGKLVRWLDYFRISLWFDDGPYYRTLRLLTVATGPSDRVVDAVVDLAMYVHGARPQHIGHRFRYIIRAVEYSRAIAGREVDVARALSVFIIGNDLAYVRYVEGCLRRGDVDAAIAVAAIDPTSAMTWGAPDEPDDWVIRAVDNPSHRRLLEFLWNQPERPERDRDGMWESVIQSTVRDSIEWFSGMSGRRLE